MIRLILSGTGDISVHVFPVTPLTGGTVQLHISSFQTDPSNTLLRHKTTSRKLYDQGLAAARQMRCVDALFTNTRGQLTQVAFTNIFVLGRSGWSTPDLQCGLLPGIWRRKFLKKTGAAASILKIADLTTAKSIVIGNSVRGSIEIDKVIDTDGAVLYIRKDNACIPQTTPSFSTPGN
jgi:4-amino-4-deoxychorismate lyase